MRGIHDAPIIFYTWLLGANVQSITCCVTITRVLQRTQEPRVYNQPSQIDPSILRLDLQHFCRDLKALAYCLSTYYTSANMWYQWVLPCPSKIASWCSAFFLYFVCRVFSIMCSLLQQSLVPMLTKSY